MNCRGCGNPLNTEDALCDLGVLPLANGLLTAEQLDQPETFYPMRPLICQECLLVQLPELPRETIFTDAYPFYAGQSAGWRDHCSLFAKRALDEYALTPQAHVLDIGSNDGTMLEAFHEYGIRAIGVEPCLEPARYAIQRGLPTLDGFWGIEMADEIRVDGWRADLVTATNVLQHVPDLQDFLCGVRMILADDGVAVFELAYLGDVVNTGAFDQVYAEHYNYFTLNSLHIALTMAGLFLDRVEFLPTHGGSIRATALRAPSSEETMPLDVYEALEKEAKTDWHSVEGMKRVFSGRPGGIKIAALKTLASVSQGRTVGYGASAKAVTLLNYCGIGPELIQSVVDTTPAKQGKYIPGVRIPIVEPEELKHANVVVNFLWNWITESEANIRAVNPDAHIIYLPAARPSPSSYAYAKVSLGEKMFQPAANVVVG